MGCANPEGATGGNIARQIALRAGCPVTVPGHDRQPLLLVGPADDRDGRAAHHRRRGRRHRRRRRRVDLLRAERGQQAHVATRGWSSTSPRSTGPCSRRPRWWPSATSISRERRTSTAPSQQRTAAPAAPGRLRGRDRADDRHDGRGRQGDGRCAPRKVTVEPDEGNRPTPRYEGVAKLKPAHAGRRDHRRQRQPVLRRRRCLRGDERQASARSAASSRSASSAASRSPAASPTRWASARCSRCPSC